eukprot:TRINITY_DN46627_c0_g1_i1.p1 TRINITY_DN46627_c0_g1~~TRINITY_DN46627_c0_g1_i1.p1  ORF type:complete len:249 (-),score=26.90 TRINITY_DN46627_c0_g1_i1:98-844(-)
MVLMEEMPQSSCVLRGAANAMLRPTSPSSPSVRSSTTATPSGSEPSSPTFIKRAAVRPTSPSTSLSPSHRAQRRGRSGLLCDSKPAGLNIVPVRSLSSAGLAPPSDMDAVKDLVVTRRNKKGGLTRRVSFNDQDQLYEAFTPYGLKYGKHPSELRIDAKCSMLEPLSASQRKPVSGDTLKCIASKAVSYCARPCLGATLDRAPAKKSGDHIQVAQVCSGWVRDSVGWLPLEEQDEPLFEVCGAAGEDA